VNRVRRFSTYAVGQALAYGIDFSGFSLMALALGADRPVALNLASKSVSALFAFFFHRQFSFPDADRRIRWASVFSFVALLAINMGLTSALLWGLAGHTPLPLLAAKFLADMIGVLVTFVLMRTFVFPKTAAP
jgi:putative flippase GtrA